MRFDSPLQRAVLLRRYKRFLADVRLADGTELTVHCANPGSMKGLVVEGGECWIRDSKNPKRKLRYSLELVDVATSLVAVNTGVTNRLVSEAILAGAIAEIEPHGELKAEVKTGQSRLDFCLEQPDRPTWIEVKQVTLAEPPTCMFPDARTERGRKHLAELEALRAAGARCVMLYVVTRSDCRVFRPADDIDPDYGQALRRATKRGVEPLVYACHVSPEELRISHRLPVEL